MDNTKLASGVSNEISQSEDVKQTGSREILDTADMKSYYEEVEENTEKVVSPNAISSITIDENDIKLKERIAQCKKIIASLKCELSEEKIKMDIEANEIQLESNSIPDKLSANNVCKSEKIGDFSDLYNANMYSASVNNKLNCDENLMEYEKQLQRYQHTLNMAQIQKKHAIRKEMLAKAFKLKLMEVESQCTIELLRIKQNLQCLAPLQMIVEKWKVGSNDNVCDLNYFELIPRYPEVTVTSGSDISISSGNGDKVTEKNAYSNLNIEKHE